MPITAHRQWCTAEQRTHLSETIPFLRVSFWVTQCVCVCVCVCVYNCPPPPPPTSLFLNGTTPPPPALHALVYTLLEEDTGKRRSGDRLYKPFLETATNPLTENFNFKFFFFFLITAVSLTAGSTVGSTAGSTAGSTIKCHTHTLVVHWPTYRGWYYATENH